jgi:hypothetical protein
MEGVVIYNALFTDFTQIGQYDGLLAPYHDLAPTPLSGHTAPTRTTTRHRGMLPAPHQSHVATKEEDPPTPFIREGLVCLRRCRGEDRHGGRLVWCLRFFHTSRP